MTDQPPPTRSLMPGWLPRFNKLVTNRIQGLWAPYLPPYAMMIHTGRRSGRTFQNPVTAFRRGALLVIPLPYGSDAQWVKNVMAAGGGEVIRRGRRQAFANPRVVTDGTEESLPRIAVRISRRIGVLIVELP
ncbi:MAG: nitroreductase family deazaflavin-dependent oxidoreductase [Solirubrobacteraceae bacterium]|nr:nitroreductase family deazaflavin-dependent oxidoreductase [Solirubrobacteraceae bacterium]